MSTFKKKHILNVHNNLRHCAERRIFLSKCKHAEESLSVVGVQLRQLVGLRPQFVSLVQVKHCPQVNGGVPAMFPSAAPLWSRVLTR